MKKTLTLALLFCIGTAIGQKTTADIKNDTLQGRGIVLLPAQHYSTHPLHTIDDRYYDNLTLKGRYNYTPKYTLSEDFSFWFKNKEYKATEIVEMLEWFRENKKKDTFALCTKPISYNTKNCVNYLDNVRKTSVLYQGANGDWITLQRIDDAVVLNGEIYVKRKQKRNK